VDLQEERRHPRSWTSRFKARLVARGFTQKEGIDFNEVFSPVVKHRSIKILMAMVAEFDLVLEQMDVKTKFFVWKA